MQLPLRNLKGTYGLELFIYIWVKYQENNNKASLRCWLTTSWHNSFSVPQHYKSLELYCDDYHSSKTYFLSCLAHSTTVLQDALLGIFSASCHQTPPCLFPVYTYNHLHRVPYSPNQFPPLGCGIIFDSGGGECCLAHSDMLHLLCICMLNLMFHWCFCKFEFNILTV